MRIINKLMDIIFPPVCGLCDDINNSFFCDKCREKVDVWKISNIETYNNDDIYFKEHCYIFKYENEIRNFIINYKFNEKSYLYKTFSKIMIEDKVFNDFISEYDCIVSVPLHKKRLKNRGYNQSKLIAKDIAEFYGKEFYENVLIKNVNTVPQSSLNKKERIKNIQNAFDIIQKEKVKDKNIAIFDDIFTTGCTANECAKLLINAGAESVGIFTLAKD